MAKSIHGGRRKVSTFGKTRAGRSAYVMKPEYLAENDVMGRGQDVYSYLRIEETNGDRLRDGTHIIYVNGATLDLGGNALTQTVVKGNGTIATGAGGSLVVTDKMVSKVGECIAASGAIDLSNAKIELADPANLASPFTFLKPVAGQTLTVTGVPTPTNLPKGWKVSVSANGTGRIVKRGLMVIVR